MPDMLKVTRAQLADVSRAAPLFAAYREFYGEPYDLEASASFLASRLARDESIVLIARNDDSVPVGFSQIYPAFSSTRLAPIWILNDLYVSEEARGTGAVDALLDTAAALAVEAGATAIELATAHTNLRAQAVYDRSGYEVDTEFKHYEKPLP
jgi:ribosomal protein S18 acetylase RimI-like enzyme